MKKDLELQRKKDLQSFGGLFDRGTIYRPTDSQALSSESRLEIPSSEQETPMTVGDALKKIQDMESAAKSLYQDGKVIESQELTEKAQSLKKEIQEYQATLATKKQNDEWLTVDYSNPSQETIETAAKMGLDLKDPRY